MKKVEAYVDGALKLRKVTDELAYDHADARLESVWYELNEEEQNLASKMVADAIRSEGK